MAATDKFTMHNWNQPCALLLGACLFALAGSRDHVAEKSRGAMITGLVAYGSP